MEGSETQPILQKCYSVLLVTVVLTKDEAQMGFIIG